MARKSEIRQFYFFEALGKNSHFPAEKPGEIRRSEPTESPGSWWSP